MASFNPKFEEASLLFNVGAIYSQLGAQEGTSTVEALKRACNLFLQAAGVFEFIQKGGFLEGLILPAGADLTDPTMTALIKLMLAQAQECFVLKALMERNVKDGMLAKLAWSTAAFFEAVRPYASVKGSPLWDWCEIISVKSLLYRSMAHYRKSSEFLVSCQYGREITKLQEADELLKGPEMKDLLKRLNSSDLQAQITSLAVAVQKNLERATKDNHLIYHEQIPARGSWGDCGVAVVAKATPFIALGETEAESDFIFDRLPSLRISRQVDEAFQKRDVLYEQFMTEAHEVLRALDEAFTRLKLPGAIEALNNPEGVPESLLTKSQELISLGGYGNLENSRATAQKLRSDCQEAIGEIREALAAEAAQDAEMRTKFGARWTRALSSQLNVLLLQRLDQLETMQRERSDQDEVKVAELYNQHVPAIISLCSTPEELAEAIPASTSRNIGFDVNLLAEITSVLPQRETIKAEVDDLFAGARTALDSIPLVQRIYELNSAEAASVVEEEMRTALSDTRLRLGNWREGVESYVRRLERQMDDFIAGQSSTVGQERETALQALDVAYGAYKQLTALLDSGLQFHQTVMSQLEQLRPVCLDWARSRREEAAKLREQLEVPEPASPTYPPTAAVDATMKHQEEAHALASMANATIGANQTNTATDSTPSTSAPSTVHAQPGAWNPSMPIQYAPMGYYPLQQQHPVGPMQYGAPMGAYYPPPAGLGPYYHHHPAQYYVQHIPGVPPQQHAYPPQSPQYTPGQYPQPSLPPFPPRPSNGNYGREDNHGDH